MTEIKNIVLFLLGVSVVGCEEIGLEDNGMFKISAAECIASQKCCDAWKNTSTMNKLTMFDSSMRFLHSGYLQMNMFDLGKYDECMGIYQEEENIYGKYCLAKLNLDEQQKFEIPKYQHLGITPRADDGNTENTMSDLFIFQYAFCMPSACTAEDLQKFIKLPPITVTEEDCYSNDRKPELTTGAIITITVLSFFGWIVILSTIYDIILHLTKKNPVHYVLLAFSAWSNGRKIFQSSTNPDQLLCLNGIKAISMMWVIFGHMFSNILMGPLDNTVQAMDISTNWRYMYLLGAPVSVDTFFLVGGLVTVYSFLKSCDKGVKFNIILFYIHRYLRLTPAYAIMVLIHATLMKYMGDGPLWNRVDAQFANDCKSHWWSSLMYIQNFVKPQISCVPQSWYLQVDFQLFLLSPLILLPLKHWPKKTLIGIGALIIAGIISPFIVTYEYDLPGMVSMNKIMEYMVYYYKQTHARFGPYVIGMMFGYIIYKVKKTYFKLGQNKRNAVVGSAWMITMFLLILCLYIGGLLIDTQTDKLSRSFYNAFHRSGWSVGVGMVILLCTSGYGGPVDNFLSLPLFQFLTKLSYSMYLVHYSIITLTFLSSRTSLHFNHYYMMTSFWGHFMFTLLISFFLCITFESPIIILEKFIFGIGQPRAHIAPQKKELPTAELANRV